ncbi:hypothetical protein AHiyo6_25420 [Arthrobacter sp. Hiyo6]|nr:hypothetical protein AHiyo6_25420 [Arthrobacter sp. Hiyo6]
MHWVVLSASATSLWSGSRRECIWPSEILWEQGRQRQRGFPAEAFAGARLVLPGTPALLVAG